MEPGTAHPEPFGELGLNFVEGRAVARVPAHPSTALRLSPPLREGLAGKGLGNLSEPESPRLVQSFPGAYGAGLFSCSTVTVVAMPPRTFQRATIFSRRGSSRRTRSSATAFVTFSWNAPSFR